MLSNARVIVQDSNGETICNIVVRNNTDYAMIRMLISEYYLHKYEEVVAAFKEDFVYTEAEKQQKMCEVFDELAKDMYSQFAIIDDLEKGDETHG